MAIERSPRATASISDPPCRLVNDAERITAVPTMSASSLKPGTPRQRSTRTGSTGRIFTVESSGSPTVERARSTTPPACRSSPGVS
ncbi:hypothetical protein [Nannocystis pusilla]|uniref:hypothetical protein n=1 Tax=Nannocystis pusilla TaxID=889268 RepID=UPI003B7B8845